MKQLREMRFTKKKKEESRKTGIILTDFIPVSLSISEKEAMQEVHFGFNAETLNLNDGFYIEKCECHPNREITKVIEIYKNGRKGAEYFLPKIRRAK